MTSSKDESSNYDLANSDSAEANYASTDVLCISQSDFDSKYQEANVLSSKQFEETGKNGEIESVTLETMNMKLKKQNQMTSSMTVTVNTRNS